MILSLPRKLFDLMLFSYAVPNNGSASGTTNNDTANENAAPPANAGDSASSASADSDGSSSEAGGGPRPTERYRAMIFRIRSGGRDPIKLGVCVVHYFDDRKIFTAYPENSPSTFNLVAVAPVPDDGGG